MRETYFEDANFTLLWFGAEYPQTFMGFGFPRRHDSYNNYLVRDEGGMRDLDVWAPNRWSHTCFSYDKGESYVRLVKVGKYESALSPELSLIQ